MITTNPIYEEMFNSVARQFVGRVEHLEGSTLLNIFEYDGALISFTVTRTSDNGKMFGYGISQILTVKLRDKERQIDIKKGQRLQAAYGIDNDYVYNCSMFIVDEVSRDENTNELTIKALDPIYSTSSHLVKELNLPNQFTLKTFAIACGTLLGMPANFINIPDNLLNVSYTRDQVNFDGEETIRTALDNLAEMFGAIYYFCNNWNVTFKRLDIGGEPVLQIDKTKYFELTAKTAHTVANLTSVTELGDNVSATSGIPGETYFLRENAFLTLRNDISTLLENILTAVKGLTIQQFTCKHRGDFRLEIGDKVSFTTKDNQIINTYVLTDSLTYSGGLVGNSSWEYSRDTTETESNPTTLGDVLKQTYAKVNKAEGYIELVAKNTQETLEQTTEEMAALKIQANQISSEVTRVEGKVDGTKTELQSQIQQTANSITSSVSAVDKKIDNSVTTLQSQIQQTNGSITSTVSRIEQIDKDINTIESQIEQNADNIELKVSKNDIISAINLSPETIDISASKLNLTGYITASDLSGNGTTTINGSNITTGTIDADRINMTGAISWGDLSSSCQSTIASYAGSDGSDADLPDYIKSTYIDEVEIRSPKITGNDIQVYNTFQTIGTIGSSAAITGYVGAAKGKIDNNTTTYGVALASSWDANSYDVAENYVIVTNTGTRMTGGNNYIYVASSGSWIETNNGDLKITTPNGTVTINGVDLGAILSGDNKMSDYVVEQGKSNNWTYRKWNSGIAECWCRKSIATTITNAWGSLYTSGGLESSNLDFPFTFSETPVVNVSCCNNGAGVFVMASGAWGPLSTTSTGMFELVRAVSSGTANTYVLCYQVMGRWK